MSKPDEWKRINSAVIADCKIFKVRKDECVNSNTKDKASFFVIENPDWVNIIALTTDENVVLIEQFRQGTEDITLEIPGGMVDENEAPLICAKRELLEETGYSSDDFIYLGKSRPNPAIQSNWIYHYFAKDCVKTGETKFDEHESITTNLVPFKEIPQLIKTNRIVHSLVLAGFYKLYIQNI